MAVPHPILIPLITGQDLPRGARITDAVIDSAQEHWVGALVDASISGRDIECDPGTRERLTAISLATRAEVETRGKIAAAVTQIGRDLDIPIGVFKGTAIARQFYPDPTTRPSVDIDIFVGPDSLPRLGELVEALGGGRTDRQVVEAMVAMDRTFELSVDVDGTIVDIHRDPMNLLLRSRREVERWKHAVSFDIAPGVSGLTLDLEDSIIQALLHLFRDNFADLLHINDVWMMMSKDPDWDVIAQRAQADGWTDILRFAVWFVCAKGGLASPMPTTIARWRRSAISMAWPNRLLLHGQASHVRTFRRHYVLGLLVENQTRAVVSGYARRLFPPRVIIDHRAGPSEDPYAVALAKWRLSQRKFFSRVWKQGLEEEL